MDDAFLDSLEHEIGGLAGKTVLDFGGGPGHYSIAMARRGARVTWHDVSKGYMELASAKCRESNVDVQFSIGYLDEAPTLLHQTFNLVFSRLCWYYGFDDYSLAASMYALVESGGWIYVDTHNSGAYRSMSLPLRARVALNEYLRLKIGHPFPPRGRVAEAFLRLGVSKMVIDYTSARNDRVLLRKD